MSFHLRKLFGSFLLGAALATASGLAALPAAAAVKEPEKVTQGHGPATLTAAELAKAEAHGISISAEAATTAVAPPPSFFRFESRPLVARPADFSTRLPATGPRDIQKPLRFPPVGGAKMGARP